MSNSPLVNYVKISPHSSNPRNQKIRKITIHHMAGNLSVETCGNVFQTRQASANYGIDSQGRVGMYVEEKNRAWTSSNKDNDNQAVTIEVANDVVGGNWHVSDIAYNKLIDLCVDICKRNNIKQLNYTGDKNGNLTMHCFFANTACPGPYLKSKFVDIQNKVNARLNKTLNENDTIKHKNYTNQEFIDFVAKIAVEDYKNHKILPSITIAQAIKESGWGKSELAQNANALFGIKKNGWTGDIYVKVATEQKADGTYYNIDNTEWRKYNSWKESIIDHNEYLCTRKIGNQKEPNWIKIIGETNLDKSLDCLQNSQYKYATSLTYKDSLKNDYILKYNLTKYDYLVLNNETNNEYDTIYYTVQKGDYLSKICNKYNVKVDDVVLWNNIKDKNKIYVGQKIEIRIKKEKEGKTTHIVEKNDTLTSISNKYNVAIDELVKMNNLIITGQELKIKN